MKKSFLMILIIVAVALILSIVIKKETKPSDKTRVILEHTYSTYVAPPCFNDVEVTNFLEDSTLGDAIEKQYEPHDECTADKLKPVKESLFVSLLRDIGFIQKKWDNW